MNALIRTFPIAWRMLTDRPARMMVSALGIAFSVLIMFMEFGFFNGLNDSSANIPPLFACDLVMSHVEKTNMKTGEEFPLLRVNQARAVPGVQAVSLLYTSANYWWNPQDGTRNRVFILGFDPTDPMLVPPEIAANLDALKQPGTVLYDRLSRRDLGVIEIGTRTTLGRSPVRVVGLVNLGPNFTYEGHLFTTGDNFLSMTGDNPNALDLGLIRVAKGENVEEVRQRLVAALPKDMLVLTPKELFDREVMFTTTRSPAGAVFGIGLIVGFAIGVIVCYQILFNEVTDHLPQFATMKAMGHRPAFLSSIVLNEALLLSFLGYLPGLVASFFLYEAIEHFTQIRMVLTAPRAVIILILSASMCLGASRLALKKIHGADPADLY